jgi:predicted transposase/invertase (TIGR01784 family)
MSNKSAAPTKLAHDSFFKSSLSIPEVANQFMQTHLPSQVLEIVDLQTLQMQADSFVKKNLKKQVSDVLFSCQTKQGAAYIYVLCEHQSKPDYWMSFRMLKYMIAIFNRHRKNFPKEKHLPLVVPLVFYNGQQKYDAPINFSQLFERPELASKFLGDYKLIDISQSDDDQLKKAKWLGAMEFFMKHAFERDLIKQLSEFTPILQEIVQCENGLEFFESILWYNISKVEKDQSTILENTMRNIIANHSKAAAPLGSLVQSWFDDGKAEGIGIGKAEGKAEGIGIGKAEGKAEGIGIGKVETALQIVKKLLLRNVPIEEIADITDLPADEVRLLAKKI